MSYEYEEVVNLVLKTNEFNVALNRAEAMFGRAKGTFDKLAIVEMRVADKTLKFDLDRAYKNVLNSIDAQTKAEVAGRTKALKISADIAAQFRKADDRDSLASIRAIEKQRLDEAKTLHSYRREMDKTTTRAEREEARALHRYRMEMDKERAQAQTQLTRQASQFNSIFAPGGRPLGITPNAPVAPSGVNASAALRAGAGAAGALGAYPAAGMLYATANAMQFLGKSSISTTAALAVFGPALAAVGTAFVAYKFIEWGAEFSRELARMSTLMLSTSASAEEFSAALDRTATSALKISSAFNMEAVDVVKAFKEALSSGIDVDDLERFVTTAATLAKATQSTVIETTNLLTSIKDAYGLSVGEMAHQSDLLFNTINLGKIHMKDFVTGFARLSDAGASAGLAIEELQIAIAGVTRVGMPANRAMTSMVALIHGLENPSEKTSVAVNKLFDGAGIRGKTMLEIIEAISKATKGGVGSLVGELFDDERARQAVKSLITANSVIRGEIVPGMKEMSTTSIAAGRAMNNLADDLGKMLTSMDNEITAKSSSVGGWLDRLMFGSAEDKATNLKKVEDDVAKMVVAAKSALERGNTEEGALRTAMATTHPHLLKRPDHMLETNVDNARQTMAKLRVAVQYAYGEIKDSAIISIREINKELFDTTLRTAKLIEDAAKIADGPRKMSKTDTKQFNARATDEQKQYLLDIESEIEDEKELLNTKKQQLATDTEAAQLKFKAERIQPIEDALTTAMMEGGNKSAVPGLQAKLEEAKKEFAAFSKGVEFELANTTAFTPYLLKISELSLAIAEMRYQISGQETTKVATDKKKVIEEVDAAAQRQATEFNDVVERMYREDTANYERAQKARLKIFKDITKNIESVQKRSSEIQADVANNILGSKLAANKDDPAAQARISRNERDVALDELKKAAGDGTSRNKYESALKRYQAASEGARDATSQIDNKRAQRLYQDDQATVRKYDEEFTGKYTETETMRGNSMSKRDNSVAVRGPQQLAKDASKEVAANKEITKVVLDAKVNLQVDGTLSDKTKLELTTMITDKLKQSWSNRNPPPSTYDQMSRSNRSPVAIDE